MSLASAGFSWGGAAVGMTIHSLVEGIALAAAVDAELAEAGAFRWAGLGAFLAIVLHKPLDSLTVGALMEATRHPRRRRVVVNALFAFAVPCGVAAFYFLVSRADGKQSQWLGPALAFAAGAFLCIASSDLLPELHFHSHDRVKLSACLLLGVALAVGLVALEHGGFPAHDHAHRHDASSADEHAPHAAGDHDRSARQGVPVNP
jgi:zinc and cadmium transporter